MQGTILKIVVVVDTDCCGLCIAVVQHTLLA